MRLIKNLFVAQSAFLLLLIAAWPLLQTGFFRMHDYTHVARLVEMVDAIQAGHFPVHWAADFGYGYGMPLFLFYGPVPFYLASIPTLLGITPVWSIKLLILFSHVLAWLGMYNLMKRWGRTVGFLAATAFLLAPYRALDLYVRGALNELFALSLLPWILHYAWLIPKQTKAAWLGLSISTAALVATHNLTAFMALPFLGLLGLLNLIWTERSNWKSNLFSLISAFGIGGLLSAFYAIPAFMEKNQTVIEKITSGYFDYHLHFLYIRQFWQVDWGYGGSVYGPDDDISFHVGRLTLALAVVTGIGALARLFHAIRHNQVRKLNSGVWLTFAVSILMVTAFYLTLFKSQWLWDRVSLLAYIQFPWRFLAVGNFFLAMLAGWSVWHVRPTIVRWTIMWIAVIAIVLSQNRFHHPEQYLTNNDDFYYTDRQRIKTNMSDILNDYLPLSFDSTLPPISTDQRIVVDAIGTTLRWETNRPHQLLAFTEEPAPGTITWNIADFAGWQYYVNDFQVYPTLLPDGRRQLATNEPIQTVGAWFASTQLRTIANGISVLALVIWLAVWIPYQRKIEYVKQ
jgi:hypothetical protein